jgi:hypothetical protein
MNYIKCFKKSEEIPREVSVKVSLFEKEAQDLGIHSVSDFYESKLFKAKHRIFDNNIICDLS